MPSRSRAHLATQTCHIKRVTLTDGRSELPANHLANIRCTPIMSVDESAIAPSRSQSIGSAMVNRKQVMIFNNYDIRSGDILVLNNREYPISDVNPWSVQEPFMVLVLNDVKAMQELDAVFVR